MRKQVVIMIIMLKNYKKLLLDLSNKKSKVKESLNNRKMEEEAEVV